MGISLKLGCIIFVNTVLHPLQKIGILRNNRIRRFTTFKIINVQSGSVDTDEVSIILVEIWSGYGFNKFLLSSIFDYSFVLHLQAQISF